MAITDRVTGQNWFGQWIYTGGTITLSGDQTKFGWEATAKMVDASGGSIGYAEYILGLKDGKATYQTFDTIPLAAGTQIAVALVEGNVGTLTWGNAGTATGKPKYQRIARTERVKIDYPFADKVLRDYSFQLSGAWIKNYDNAPATDVW